MAFFEFTLWRKTLRNNATPRIGTVEADGVVVGVPRPGIDNMTPNGRLIAHVLMAVAAKQVISETMESGWEDPPYDPFALAALLGIRPLVAAEGRQMG